MVQKSKNIRAKSIEDLSRKEAAEELKALKREIAEHNRAYHEYSTPLIDDFIYDDLYRRNELIEKRFPDLILKDSPSFSVGFSPAQHFEKVPHFKPMLSLSNGFEEEDIAHFLQRIRRFLLLEEDESIAILAEPKIDGLSVSLRYERGRFVQGVTRGDGHVGEAITDNIKTIADVPKKLRGDNYPEILEVRGEVYMTRRDFESLNQQQGISGKKLFSTPRNAASESLRQLDPKITAERPLRFFAWGYGETSTLPFESWYAYLQALQEWGFPTPSDLCLCSSLKEILIFYNRLLACRDVLEYDIDGIVYKVDRLDWQSRLGNVSRSPRWAIAHKFPAEEVKTKLEKIKIQVGRTGALTPIACLEPILLGGVVISRATLHNEDEIIRKDIREGDIVTIKRAGDVIPQVTNRLVSERSSFSKAFVMPNRCPECHSLTERKEGEAARRCLGGLSCPAQRLEGIRHFVSRDAFDIEGLGGKSIEQFISLGFIHTVADIFSLENDHGEDIKQLEGWGEKSVMNLFQAIRARRSISLERFIYALGIRKVGRITAGILARYYGQCDSWIEAMRSAGETAEEKKENIEWQELMNIDGIGAGTASDIISFFREEHNVEVVEKLLSLLEVSPVESRFSLSPVNGKAVVFTGKLQQMGRQEATALAERLGARVMNTVSSKTDYVVIGEGAGSKEKKARELDIHIFHEMEWLSFINGYRKDKEEKE